MFPVLLSMACASSVAAFGLSRKPPWPRQKLLLYGLGTAFMSHDLGEVGTWTIRQRWMQQLENQRGFETAMNNIEARLKKEQIDLLRRPKPPGMDTSKLPQIPPPPPSANDRGYEEFSQPWAWQSENQESSRSAPVQRTQEPEEEDTNRPQSRWDEIRRTQQQSTPQRSAWDRVREGQVRDPSPSERGGRESRYSDAERERAAAQAEFDRLLENERRMS